MKCPHCGKEIEATNEQRATEQIGKPDLSDHADAGGRGNQRGKSRGAYRRRHRKLPREQASGGAGHHKNARIITIAIDLASGRYEGPATVIDEEKRIVTFPWKGNPHHQVWLAKEEIEV